MILKSILIDVGQTAPAVELDNAQQIFSESVQLLSKAGECMTQLGFASLESRIAEAVESVLGCSANHTDLSALGRSSRYEAPTVFSTCYVNAETLVFCDIEIVNEKYALEIDVFAQSRDRAQDRVDQVIEAIRRSFGLTASRDDLLMRRRTISPMLERIRKRLTLSTEIVDSLYQAVKDGEDREVLISLKKRGTVLARDLGDLAVGGKDKPSVKATLDYLSGQDFRLVQKKVAIVCKDTGEILFLLDDANQLEGQPAFQCPKCSRPLADEDIEAYYGSTDNLRELIDANRWMPITVKEALVAAGVKADHIFTEAMHGDDEIDVLAVYQSTVFVVEVKGRPISLNDAYKLSSKTSRLENLLRRSESEIGIDEDLLMAYDDMQATTTRGSTRYRIPPRIERSNFVPVMISTHEIAQDAATLLKDNSENALLLDHSDGKIEGFIEETIEAIDRDRLKRRFRRLTSAGTSVPDSVPNFAAALVQSAFQQWLLLSD
jgi:hypothetical protein